MCLLLYYKLATHDNTSVINVSMIMSILGWKENHSWWCLLGLVHDNPEMSVIFILFSRFTPQPHSGCLVCSRSKRKPPKGCVLFAYFCPTPAPTGGVCLLKRSPKRGAFVAVFQHRKRCICCCFSAPKEVHWLLFFSTKRGAFAADFQHKKGCVCCWTMITEIILFR